MLLIRKCNNDYEGKVWGALLTLNRVPGSIWEWIWGDFPWGDDMWNETWRIYRSRWKWKKKTILLCKQNRLCGKLEVIKNLVSTGVWSGLMWLEPGSKKSRLRWNWRAGQVLAPAGPLDEVKILYSILSYSNCNKEQEEKVGNVSDKESCLHQDPVAWQSMT